MDILISINIAVNVATIVTMVLAYKKLFKKPKGVALSKMVAIRKDNKK